MAGGVASVEGGWWAAGVCQWSECGTDTRAERGPSQRAAGVEKSEAAGGDGDDGGGGDGGAVASRAAGVLARVQAERAGRRWSHVDRRHDAGRRGGRCWRQMAGGVPPPVAGRSVLTGMVNCIQLLVCAVALVTSLVPPIQNLGFRKV